METCKLSGTASVFTPVSMKIIGTVIFLQKGRNSDGNHNNGNETGRGGAANSRTAHDSGYYRGRSR